MNDALTALDRLAARVGVSVDGWGAGRYIPPDLKGGTMRSAIAFDQITGGMLGAVPDTGLLFGLMLVFAIGGGYAAHALRVPRVVGYLFAGVLLSVLLHDLLDARPGSAEIQSLQLAERPLQAVKDLALGLILFTIGSAFETRHIRAVGKNMLTIGLSETCLTAVLVTLVVLGVASLVSPPASWGTVLAFSVLLGLTAMATAPAATLFTLKEYEAKGPVTDTLLSLTGLNNVLCIVLFHAMFLTLVGSGLLEDVTLDPRDAWLGIVFNTIGSVALGLVLGFVVSVVHAKLDLAESLLILLAVMIVLGAGEQWLFAHFGVSYNFLLTALCVGAVFSNVAIDPERMEGAIRTVGKPLFVGFFALAGYQLHIDDFVRIGWIGVAYTLARVTGKVVGCYVGVRLSGRPFGLKPTLGTGLFCQAAVAIGLADFVATHWRQEWAMRAFPVTVLGSVVIFELTGPLLIKLLVVRAGEVKAVSLLRRSASRGTGGQSIIRLTADAMLRSVGLRRTGRRRTDEPLCARHIMRTNIKCIPADARLDDVLHFIERSNYNHFPVIDDQEHLAGVLHFSDIRDIIYDPVLSELVTAADLASPLVRSATVDTPVETLMTLFRDANVGSLPVVESAESPRVVGIIEQRDVLRMVRRG